MMIFYDCQTAPSPRRARILLAEKGVKVQTVEINLRTSEQFSEAFRAINPQCTVPALKTLEGQLLTDNAAIAAYLEASFSQPAMLGVSALERAEVASLNWRIEFDGLMAIAEALRNQSPAMVNRALPGPINYEQIPALAKRGTQRVAHFFDWLDTHLAGRDFVANTQLSIADITAAVAVDFARVIKIQPTEQHQNLRRWRAALANRPAFNL